MRPASGSHVTVVGAFRRAADEPQDAVPVGAQHRQQRGSDQSVRATDETSTRTTVTLRVVEPRLR